MSDIKLNKRHDGQIRLADNARRFNVASMGRRWGKTVFGIDLLIDSDERGCIAGNPVAWFAPTYKMLDDVFRQACRALGTNGNPNIQQKRIDTVNGGVIDFWTLDTPDAGRGRKYARVVVDEAAMARHLEEAWTAAIRPTLTDLAGDAWFFSTPKGLNYFYELFQRSKTDDNWASFTAPTADNPYIPAEEIEAARLELPSLVFRQEYLAEFLDVAGGSVQREWLRYGDAPDGLRVSMGVDLAISTKEGADYTAAVVLGRAKDGQIYVLDAQRTRAPFHKVLAFVRALAERWHPAKIAIEQVQYQAAVVQELLRTTELPVAGVRPDRDKATRFAPMLARYEHGQVTHCPNLPPYFEQELLSFPVGQHDDLCDAQAYALGGFKQAPLRAVPFQSTAGASPWAA